MIARTIIVIGALLCCCSGLQAKQGHWDRIVAQRNVPKAPTIKVLIAKDIPGTMLDVQGKYNIYDPYDGHRLGTRFFPKSSYIQPLPEGIKWGEMFPGVYQLVFVPDHDETLTVINGISYRGSTYVYQVEGTLNIVNEVNIEDYISSILTTQFSSGYSEEVLAALAIAARSDACYRALHSKNLYFHVAAEKVGYHGFAATYPGDSIDKAMQSTKNLVLSREPAFSGQVKPVLTRCLAKEYGDDKVQSNWSTERAEEMVKEGEVASKILATLFPETTIQVLETLSMPTESNAPVAISEQQFAENREVR